MISKIISVDVEQKYILDYFSFNFDYNMIKINKRSIVMEQRDKYSCLCITIYEDGNFYKNLIPFEQSTPA